jgi:hypothetical protein
MQRERSCACSRSAEGTRVALMCLQSEGDSRACYSARWSARRTSVEHPLRSPKPQYLGAACAHLEGQEKGGRLWLSLFVAEPSACLGDLKWSVSTWL